MTNTKHTPGPWNLEAGRSIVTSSGSFYLSYGKDKAFGAPYFSNFCELDSNARLIAAAPDLLEAVRWAADFLTDMQEDAHAARFAELVRKVERP